MGYLSKGLAALLGEEPNKASATAPRAADKSIDEMNELELMYQLCTTDGLELAGDPTRAFAAYDPNVRKLMVYSMNDTHVSMSPCNSTSRIAVLECAQAQGASFMTNADEVICVLKGVTAKGKTYAEAALRALAKHQLSIKPE